ncbi:GNAT family N-acetyltransferase [Paenibacillus rhizoplanae]|uniref:GNAT family N-acetyltransferase n=1 Tax=Paenibacillus rhizoplanae TaxID=1917181 RepID=A0ABW5F4A5_9BACL
MRTMPTGTTSISTAPITIEPMEAKYNHAVGLLLAQAFQGKFQNRIRLKEGELAGCFEMLLQYAPADPYTHRMVAVQQGEVIGSIAIKRTPEARLLGKRQTPPLPGTSQLLGKRGMIRMLIGLYVLDHTPASGECYITDLAVQPEHQNKGVGRLLVEWAQKLVDTDPGLNRLSLHVSAGNPHARQLYGKWSFHTEAREIRYTLYLLFNELRWEYMVQKRGGYRNEDNEETMDISANYSAAP